MDNGASDVAGTVRHLTFEGGAWGIVTDDGDRLLPVNLDAELRKDGLRVLIAFEEVSVMSVVQWGRTVRLTRSVFLDPDA